MKRPLLLLTLLLTVTPVFATPAIRTRQVHGLTMLEGVCLDSLPVDCKKAKNNKGKLDGVQVCSLKKSPNQKIYEAHYRNGKPDGMLRCWTQEGEPTIEAEYQKGKITGKVHKDWEPKLNRFLLDAEYRNDLPNGLSEFQSTVIDENDVQITGLTVRRYVQGEEQGFALAIENGQVASISDCRIGGKKPVRIEDCEAVKMGPYQASLDLFLENQKNERQKACNGNKRTQHGSPSEFIIEISTLKDCRKEGVSTLLMMDAKTKLAETPYAKGLREGEQKVYFPDGRISKIIHYKRDERTRLQEFFQNGQRKLDAEFKEKEGAPPKLEMKVKTFHDDGSLKEIYTVLTEHDFQDLSSGLHGVSDMIPSFPITGCQIKYDIKGEKISETCFDSKGDRNGTAFSIQGDEIVEQFFKDGQMVSEKTFDRHSKKQKKFEEFYPDGSRKHATAHE